MDHRQQPPAEPPNSQSQSLKPRVPDDELQGAQSSNSAAARQASQPAPLAHGQPSGHGFSPYGAPPAMQQPGQAFDWSSLTAAQREVLLQRLHARQNALRLQQAQQQMQFFQQAQARQQMQQAGLIPISRRPESETALPPQKVARSAVMAAVQPNSNAPPIAAASPPAPSVPQQARPVSRRPPLLVSYASLARAVHDVPPFHDGMQEAEFSQSLTRFLACIGIPFNSLPTIANRAIPMCRFYQIVTAFGGYHAIEQKQRWPAAVASLAFPPQVEWVRALKSMYHTLLYAYEQYFFLHRPIQSIEWPIPVVVTDMPSGERLSSKPPSPQPRREAEISAAGKKKPLSPQPAPSKQLAHVQAGAKPAEPPKPPPFSFVNAVRAFSRAQRLPTHLGDLGSISYHDLVYELKSGNHILQMHALNALQSIAHTPELPIGQQAFDSVIDELLAFDPPMLTGCTSFFELWAGELKAQELQFKPLDDRWAIRGQVSNCYRAWSFRPDTAELLARHARFTGDYLLPIVLGGSTLEVYKNAWIILDNLVPQHVSLVDLAELLPLVRGELQQILPLARSRFARAFLPPDHVDEEGNLSSEAAAMQHKALLHTTRAIPQHLFLQLSVLAKLVAYNYAHQAVLADASFLDRLAEFATLFFGGIMCTVAMVRTMVSHCPPGELEELLKTFVYSTRYSFPDAGYTELCITLLLLFLRKGSLEHRRRFVQRNEQFVYDLASMATCLMHLWMHPSTKLDLPSTLPALAAMLSEAPNSQPLSLLTKTLELASLLVEHSSAADELVLEGWAGVMMWECHALRRVPRLAEPFARTIDRVLTRLSMIVDDFTGIEKHLLDMAAAPEAHPMDEHDVDGMVT